MNDQNGFFLFGRLLFSVFLMGYTESTEDCIYGKGEDYRGTISTTESGHTCQRWDSVQTGFNHLEENYCRNPDGDTKPWCYSLNPSKPWEYCSIPHCNSTAVPEFTCTTGNGRSYRGTISVTRSGKTCQKWASQTPHIHAKTPDKLPNTGLEENYCRNPDFDSKPWCYTNDPDTRWEFCNVPSCEGSLTCGQAETKPKECLLRVVSGCVSNPHSWPWQISLRIGSDKAHCCGGTLINAQWVLTAAHCTQECPSPYKIFLGTHTTQGNDQSKLERSVSKIVERPSGADLALLKLDSPVELNDKVSLACLPEKDYILPHDTECFVTGWGETQGTGGEGYLKEAGVPIIKNEICNTPEFLKGRIKDYEMCAGNKEGGTDTCQGDSGGPLVCKAENKFILQGVTSWGVGCAQAKKPGVYVRVSKFVDWIIQTLNEN